MRRAQAIASHVSAPAPAPAPAPTADKQQHPTDASSPAPSPPSASATLQSALPSPASTAGQMMASPAPLPAPSPAASLPPLPVRTRSPASALLRIHAARWNGWGFADTAFDMTGSDTSSVDSAAVMLTGSRYSLSGKSFPNLRPWVEEKLGFDVSQTSPAQDFSSAVGRVPPASLPADFCGELLALLGLQQFDTEPLSYSAGGETEAWMQTVDAIDAETATCFRASVAAADRLAHAHGHTSEDIWKLRYGSFDRVPDIVLWPCSHAAVAAIVTLVSKAEHSGRAMIIPFGAGTTVCHAVEPPSNESRCIISLDMRCMTRILWLDRASRLACVEAGVVGVDLEETLSQKFGLCTGHEPDSAEFSTLGGWIATRASGMKKNVYGNIEDIVVNAALVTPRGVLERGCVGAPRISCGPDVNNFIIGSEGTLGVVTCAVVKLRPVPKVRRYGSIIFKSFEDGVSFMEKLAARRIAPASVRLVDNPQFQLGALLKPAAESLWSTFTDSAKKVFVTRVLGFDVDKMVAATLSFEGDSPARVKAHEEAVYSTAKESGGVAGGEENGIRGYFLTYMIAYIRDFGYQYQFMAESFETSVPWSRVRDVCEKTKDRIQLECEARGIQTPYVSARVTQTYDSGAAVYFYFGFIFRNLSDPVKTYAEIEMAARDEVVANGGSVSHHHGIGKLRQKWVEQTISPAGVEVLRSVKNAVDPQNVFGVGNLLPQQ